MHAHRTQPVLHGGDEHGIGHCTGVCRCVHMEAYVSMRECDARIGPVDRVTQSNARTSTYSSTHSKDCCYSLKSSCVDSRLQFGFDKSIRRWS